MSKVTQYDINFKSGKSATLILNKENAKVFAQDLGNRALFTVESDSRQQSIDTASIENATSEKVKLSKFDEEQIEIFEEHGFLLMYDEQEDGAEFKSMLMTSMLSRALAASGSSPSHHRLSLLDGLRANLGPVEGYAMTKEGFRPVEGETAEADEPDFRQTSDIYRRMTDVNSIVDFLISAYDAHRNPQARLDLTKMFSQKLLPEVDWKDIDAVIHPSAAASEESGEKNEGVAKDGPVWNRESSVSNDEDIEPRIPSRHGEPYLLTTGLAEVLKDVLEKGYTQDELTYDVVEELLIRNANGRLGVSCGLSLSDAHELVSMVDESGELTEEWVEEHYNRILGERGDAPAPAPKAGLGFLEVAEIVKGYLDEQGYEPGPVVFDLSRVNALYKGALEKADLIQDLQKREAEQSSPGLSFRQAVEMAQLIFPSEDIDVTRAHEIYKAISKGDESLLHFPGLETIQSQPFVDNQVILNEELQELPGGEEPDDLPDQEGDEQLEELDDKQ